MTPINTAANADLTLGLSINSLRMSIADVATYNVILKIFKKKLTIPKFFGKGFMKNVYSLTG